MVSDTINPDAFIPSNPKDLGKKKRANRSAKLKQCKLDARREQWLSQGVSKNKGIKEEPMGSRGAPPLPGKSERKKLLEKLEMSRRDEDENGSVNHNFDSDSSSNSPTGSSVLGSSISGTSFTGSSSSSSSSGSSGGGGCCSGSVTEEEDNCLDDWEAIADALAADDENKQSCDENCPCLESGSEPTQECEPCVQLDPNCGTLNQHSPNPAPQRIAPANTRAWRPDDECRPPSLPNLSKQRSMPNTDRHYRQEGFQWDCASAGAVNGPSPCPLCAEDLDITDASFLPCSCRYQVCLFCYKKMLELDGRCPNCRKLYEHIPVEAEAIVHGGSLTVRLPRSFSMIARS